MSVGELQNWRNQPGKHQKQSLSQTVLTLEERLFAQGEHCEYDFGGNYVSINLIPLSLPTTNFHKLDLQVKKLKQNSVSIKHHKGWANMKLCKNHQSARAFSQSICLNKLAHVETENKKPSEYTVKNGSLNYSTCLHFHNKFFQQRRAMMVRTMEASLITACL